MRFASFVGSAFLVASVFWVARPAPAQAILSASPAPLQPSPVATSVAAFPTPTAAQGEALMQDFARMQAEHQQLRAQTRARFLAALSPAHRSLVATLVGQLAVSPQPDPAATARQIDAALSPEERQSILRIDAAALSDSAALARQMQLRLESQLTAEQRAAIDRQMAQARADMERRLSPDQRAALQRAAGSFGMPLLAGTLPFAPRGAGRDAGSVLLHELTLPSSMPYGITSSIHAGGTVLMQSVTASPQR